MNAPDGEELSLVRQLLQEALARAERAEAECAALRQRPWSGTVAALEGGSRQVKEILQELEDACRELSRLHRDGGDDELGR